MLVLCRRLVLQKVSNPPVTFVLIFMDIGGLKTGSVKTSTMAACCGSFADDCDKVTDKVNESNAKKIAFVLLFFILTGHGVNYYLHGKK